MGAILKFIVALLFAVSTGVSAQCFGPGSCTEPPPDPGTSYGPARICIGPVCVPVEYEILDRFVVAKAPLPVNGYVQLGWSGPCTVADVTQCPGLWNQAAQDLELNLLRINRALK